MHGLGDYLLRVALEEMFNRPTGHKGQPSKSFEYFNRSITYWHTRHANPRAPVADAISAARARYPNPPSESRMARIARQYRKRALHALEAWHIEHMPDGTIKKTRTGLNTRTLRRRLRRRSERGEK